MMVQPQAEANDVIVVNKSADAARAQMSEPVVTQPNAVAAPVAQPEAAVVQPAKVAVQVMPLQSKPSAQAASSSTLLLRALGVAAAMGICVLALAGGLMGWMWRGGRSRKIRNAGDAMLHGS